MQPAQPCLLKAELQCAHPPTTPLEKAYLSGVWIKGLSSPPEMLPGADLLLSQQTESGRRCLLGMHPAMALSESGHRGESG